MGVFKKNDDFFAKRNGRTRSLWIVLFDVDILISFFSGETFSIKI